VGGLGNIGDVLEYQHIAGFRSRPREKVKPFIDIQQPGNRTAVDRVHLDLAQLATSTGRFLEDRRAVGRELRHQFGCASAHPRCPEPVDVPIRVYRDGPGVLQWESRVTNSTGARDVIAVDRVRVDQTYDGVVQSIRYPQLPAVLIQTDIPDKP